MHLQHFEGANFGVCPKAPDEFIDIHGGINAIKNYLYFHSSEIKTVYNDFY